MLVSLNLDFTPKSSFFSRTCTVLVRKSDNYGTCPKNFREKNRTTKVHLLYFKNIDSDMTSNSVETQNNQLNRECNAGTKRIEDLVRFMADKKRENYNQKLFVFRQNRFNNRKKSSTRTIRKTSWNLPKLRIPIPRRQIFKTNGVLLRYGILLNFLYFHRFVLFSTHSVNILNSKL